MVYKLSKPIHADLPDARTERLRGVFAAVRPNV